MQLFGIILALSHNFHSMIEEVLVDPSIWDREIDYCRAQFLNHLKIYLVERKLRVFKTGKDPRIKCGQTQN